MTEEEKRAAIAAYREQKVESGIYALSCLPSGQRWVGSALNLATIRNRLWFTLRLGHDQHPGLQDAWNTHGEDGFDFEILERLTGRLPCFSLRLPAAWRSSPAIRSCPILRASRG
jgi:hypothetical protein